MRWLESTDSTNADLGALARQGAPDGTVVATTDQRRGRGRLDRQWSAPPGCCLAVSILARPQVSVQHWGWLPLLAGLALAEAIEGLDPEARTRLGLKWPNDLVLADQPGKVAGILTERVATPSGDAAIIGIGVNLHLDEQQRPVPLARALADVGLSVEPPVLVEALADRFEDRIAQWQRQGAPHTDYPRADYQRACLTIGQQVAVHQLDGTTCHGRAIDVDADGALVVREQQSGRTVTVLAGDVQHLRPATADPDRQI